MRSNNHHVFNTRREWNKTPLRKAVRNHPLTQFEMYTEAHGDLHASVGPVPMLDHDVLGEMLIVLEDLSLISPPDMVIHTIVEVSDRKLRRRKPELARNFKDNLLSQLGFIEDGLFEG